MVALLHFKVMTIEFRNIGAHLGARFHGAEVRSRIVAALNEGEKMIIFDLGGVESISNSFADECFAKLALYFSIDEIKGRTTFINGNSFIRSVIADAFKARLTQIAV